MLSRLANRNTVICERWIGFCRRSGARFLLLLWLGFGVGQATALAQGPPEPPEPRPAYTEALTPPSAIRVRHHPANTCRDRPPGQIDTIPFEDYVRRVLPAEVPASWPLETLKAQAVAARTFAWQRYLANPAAEAHVSDWTDTQVMCDATYAATDAAVAATAGMYLAYQGWPISAMYSAENASPTRTNFNVGYLQGIEDPVSLGQTRFGHGYGMGQWGAQRWAANYNWPFSVILLHYYTNVTLEQGLIETGNRPPLVSLARPRPGDYLNSNLLWFDLGLSDEDPAALQTQLQFSRTAILQTDLLPGRYNTIVDIRTRSDRPLTQALTITARATDTHGLGNTYSQRVGLDRVPPQGRLTTLPTLTGSTALSGTILTPVFIAAEDATAGVDRLVLGDLAWRWEEQAFAGSAGELVSDPAALDGWARQIDRQRDPPGAWQTAATLNLPPGLYRAYFRLRSGDVSLPNEVLLAEVFEAGRAEPRGLRRIYGVAFRAADAYQEFHLDFDHPGGGDLYFKLTFHGLVDFALDRVTLYAYPQPFAAGLDLPPGQYRLKLIDRADNVSEDLTLLLWWPEQIHLPLLLRD